MRTIHLTIFLKPVEEFIVLPIQYNHLVQAAIYNSIDAELAAFLHEKGFADGNRSFKLFAVSLLRGEFQIHKEASSISFKNAIQLTVSSPVDDFCQSLANILLKEGLSGWAIMRYLLRSFMPGSWWWKKKRYA